MLKGNDKKRFNTEVRNLKKKADENGWNLMTLEEATLDSVCVLSDNDMDVNFEPDLCDENSESYFLAGMDLMEYLEIE